MAITKAVSANPVRGYYVTLMYNGRRVLKSGVGTGFGAPRLGGLINARVDGLTGGGTAGSRLLTPMAGAGAEAAKAAIQADAKVEPKADAKVAPAAAPVHAEAVKSDVSKSTPEHLEAKKEDIKKPDSVK